MDKALRLGLGSVDRVTVTVTVRVSLGVDDRSSQWIAKSIYIAQVSLWVIF